MMVLVIGRQGSGKSKRAEEIAGELSGGGRTIYLATMIPYGEEGEKRIQRHRRMREGKGFFTIECPSCLSAMEKDISEEDTLLLECVSNLVANEMHMDELKSYSDMEIADYVTREILFVSERVKDMIVVSNSFKADDSFDAETLRYIRLNDMVNDRLKEVCDRIVEI